MKYASLSILLTSIILSAPCHCLAGDVYELNAMQSNDSMGEQSTNAELPDTDALLAIEEGASSTQLIPLTRLQKFLVSNWYTGSATFIGGLVPFAASTATKPTILKSKIDAAASQSKNKSAILTLSKAALINSIIMGIGNTCFYYEPFTGLDEWVKLMLIGSSQFTLLWGIAEKSIKTAQKEALINAYRNNGINPYDYKKATKEEAKIAKKKQKMKGIKS